MKKVIYILLGIFLGLGIGLIHVRAQTTPPPFTVVSTLPHTSCPTPVANTSQYCLALDGPYMSLSGAAYVPMMSSSGVSSWNGQTGAVTFTSPVTSVNGKTGAVTITATTALQ